MIGVKLTLIVLKHHQQKIKQLMLLFLVFLLISFSAKQTLSYGVHKGFAPYGPGGVTVVDGATQEIEPETNINHEIGWRSYDGLEGMEFTYFMNNYDNLLGANEAAGTGTDACNGGAVDISGFELYLRRMLWEGQGMQIPIELAYTHTNTEFKESFDGDFWGMYHLE